MTEQAQSGSKWWVAVLAAVALACAVGIPAGALTMIAGLAALSSADQAAAAGDCGAGEAGVAYASSGEVRLPVVGDYTYTSPYGMRLHPIQGAYRLHAGLDLVSNGDVVAPQAAQVQSVTMGDPGAGNFVVLDHGDGITSRYLHMSSVAVRVGQKLQVGQKIGVEGTTGGSTGVHLHFEIRKNGAPTDPTDWLKKHGINLPTLGGTARAPGAGEHSADADIKIDKAVIGRQIAGSGFDLPTPGTERSQPGTSAMSIPANVQEAYESAGRKYGLPWQLLAGVGMAETGHGRDKRVSSAGAMGPMQFMPGSWLDFGVDANGDGKADILNPMDAAHAAANLLSQNGASESADGVRRAILRYNQSSAYVNDVLTYTHQYAKGKIQVEAAGDDCGRVDAGMASNQTTNCPATDSPAENGLQKPTRAILRCGAQAAPWLETMYGLGDRAGPTDHNVGKAIDFMVPHYDSAQGKKRGQELAKWMQRNARRLGIKYVIWDQQIWNIERPEEGWRPMEDRGSPTENHKDHVHVSAV